MIALTRPGKHTLTIENPVMNAAGTLGFADETRDMVALDRLGAFVTNPVTASARTSASGTQVIPLDAGVLLHTGLPNPGVRAVVDARREAWARLPVPLIVHVAAGSPDDLKRCLDALDAEDVVAGVEIGVQDDSSGKEAAALMRAVQNADKPTLFRLPFGADVSFARTVVDAGAGGLTISAPPRGTARDRAGQLVAGRLYGTWVHPLNLRLLGQITRKVDVPVVASGGIHSSTDARSYLSAGAVAVQIDALAWSRPGQVELIARDLAGLVLTQPVGALPDEWFPGMGETARRQQDEGRSDGR
jgi:dihydroorotate dehydrogenase (NAD+) catalytic subunit